MVAATVGGARYGVLLLWAIAIGAFFPVYMGTLSGIRDVDRKLVELARLYGLAGATLARRVLLPEALAAAETLRAHLRGAAGAREVEIAGDLRRWTESVDALALVVASDCPRDTIADAQRLPLLTDVAALALSLMAVRFASRPATPGGPASSRPSSRGASPAGRAAATRRSSPTAPSKR